MANEEIREENIKKVLNCTIECFKIYGLEATTLKMVAKHSGLSTRSVQRYFGTKNNLVMQTMALLLGQSFIELKNYFEGTAFLSLTGFEQVIEILRIRAEHVKKHYDIIIILTELEVYFSKNHLSLDMFRKYMGDETGYVETASARALDIGLRDGSIKQDVNKTVAFQMMTTAYKGMMQSLAFLYNDKTLAQEVKSQTLVNSFICILTEYLKN
ncbi:MAG: helix-turn-helix domain-containing protein [Angelakisella sp.]